MLVFNFQDIDVEITHKIDTVIGENIAFKLTFRNVSDFPRIVSGKMTLESTWYTGIIHDVIRRQDIDLVVPAARGKYIFFVL